MKERILTEVFIILLIFIMVTYCYQIKMGIVEPRLATWIIFSIGSTMSLISYFFASKGRRSILNNLANTGDVFVTVIILSTLILSGFRIKFNFFDRWCLLLALTIAFIWIITRRHDIAYILLQILMTVGYFPTLKHLWFANQNSESFMVWISGFFVSLIAFYISYQKKKADILASLYVLRSCLFVAILLILMVRAEYF